MLNLNPSYARPRAELLRRARCAFAVAAVALLVGRSGIANETGMDGYQPIPTQMQQIEIDTAIAQGDLQGLSRLGKASRLNALYEAMIKNERERIAILRSMARRRAAAQLAAEQRKFAQRQSAQRQSAQSQLARDAATVHRNADPDSSVSPGNRPVQITNFQDSGGEGKGGVITLLRPKGRGLSLSDALVVESPPTKLASSSAAPSTPIDIARSTDLERSSPENGEGGQDHVNTGDLGSTGQRQLAAKAAQSQLESVVVDHSLENAAVENASRSVVKRVDESGRTESAKTDSGKNVATELPRPPVVPPALPTPTPAATQPATAHNPTVVVAQVPLPQAGSILSTTAAERHETRSASQEPAMGLADLMAATPVAAIGQMPSTSPRPARDAATTVRAPADHTRSALGSVQVALTDASSPSQASQSRASERRASQRRASESHASQGLASQSAVDSSAVAETAVPTESSQSVEYEITEAAPPGTIIEPISKTNPRPPRSDARTTATEIAAPQISAAQNASRQPTIELAATEATDVPARSAVATRPAMSLPATEIPAPANASAVVTSLSDKQATAPGTGAALAATTDKNSVNANITAAVPNAAAKPDANVAMQWPFTLGGSEQLPVPTGGSDVTLSVDDVDVRTVLEMLAKGYGMNILVAPDVTGTVTANVSGLSPEQTLRSVIRMCGLAIEQQDNVILVYPKDNLPLESRQLRVFPLDFVRSELIEPAVTGLLSPIGSAYTSKVDELDNRRGREAIVVIDTPEILSQVEQYLMQADQPPRQVMIEARILEIDLKDDMEHGVNFEYLLSGDVTLGAARITPNIPTPTNPFFFAEIDGTRLDALITMLETTFDGKTLATPRVMVVNGQNAKIQVGQQLGFAVATVTQTSTIQDVRYLDTGIVLQVTPTISRDNRILLQVKPKVSSGEINVDTLLPEETTREVETSVMLDNHQGMIIGGLIQEDDGVSIRKMPWLGDVKYVGKLFQRRETTRRRTEVIVALIPHIVDPCQDGHCSPHDPLKDQIEWERTENRLFNGPLNRECRPWEARLPDITGEDGFHRDIERQRNRNPYGKGCEPIKTGLLHFE